MADTDACVQFLQNTTICQGSRHQNTKGFHQASDSCTRGLSSVVFFELRLCTKGVKEMFKLLFCWFFSAQLLPEVVFSLTETSPSHRGQLSYLRMWRCDPCVCDCRSCEASCRDTAGMREEIRGAVRTGAAPAPPPDPTCRLFTHAKAVFR